MESLAASAFAITSAALMGYCFALLLVVRKKQEGKKRSIANLLPLFPLVFMFYFVMDSFALTKEAIGIAGVLLMIAIGYEELLEGSE